MVTRNRRMPSHDFLLIAISSAVIVLSNWPESKPRQWVQIRDQQGSLQQYSFAEQDPAVSKLRLSLEKWARAGQETRLAVAQWRAELAGLYAEKTNSRLAMAEDPGRRATKIVQAVSFRSAGASPSDSEPSDSKAGELASLREQQQHWLQLGEQAERDIADVIEIRRSRKALEVPPPIVFGPIESGHIPTSAFFVSLGVGSLVGLLFAAWSFCSPSIRLDSKPTGVSIDPTEEFTQSDSELRLVVPASWIRVRQPIGVVTRWAAMGLLAIVAVGTLLV